MADFQQILQNGYSKKKKDKIGDYELDKQLSTHNDQIYYNKKDNKLLHNINGTNSLYDWVDNIKLGLGKFSPFGGFKESTRYKTSHDKLRQAKQKYNIDNATVTGHSQAGFTAGHIASKQDRVLTLDRANTIGQHTRANETTYRTKGDIVSALGANAKHTVNLENPNKQTGIAFLDILNSHNVDNIKNKNIMV